jgi:hypothetical protein
LTKEDFKKLPCLAMELIQQCHDQNISGTFTFDSFYSTVEILNFIDSRKNVDGTNRRYVGDVKFNRTINFKGRKKTSREVSTLPSEIEDKIIDESYLIPHYHLHLMPTQAVVYPPEGMQFWDTPGIEKEYYKSKTQGVVLSPFAKYPVKIALSQLQFVNDVARDIYYFANGKLTGKEIYVNVLQKNKAADGTHRDACYNFMRKMISQQHISLSSIPSEERYTTSGSEDYFVPVHVSLEVTAQCNARCKHCYGVRLSRFFV